MLLDGPFLGFGDAVHAREDVVIEGDW